MRFDVEIRKLGQVCGEGWWSRGFGWRGFPNGVL